MAINGQYREPLFGVAMPDGTGAGGSPLADVTSSPDVGAAGSATIRDVYQSSQTPGDSVTVDRSDTASSSANNYDGGNGLVDDPDRAYGDTGAGHGSVGGPAHPNAMSVPALAVQVARARRSS